MKGISKARLIEIYNNYGRQNKDYACVVNSIISECKELDPWLPIDENTPKDRNILLLVDNQCVQGYWSVYHWCSEFPSQFDGMYGLNPTHWQELPPDPKE